jgi:hypothetical protein
VKIPAQRHHADEGSWSRIEIQWRRSTICMRLVTMQQCSDMADVCIISG